MKQQKDSQLTYLRKYHKIQKDIMLVFRDKPSATWSDRCLFLSPEYAPFKPYNHRSILKNEIVIEFDDDSHKQNKLNANVVYNRLTNFGLQVAKFESGNKSVHVHTFIDHKNCVNLSTFKRVFMRYFGTMYKDGDKWYYDKKDIPEDIVSKCTRILPDMRLGDENHLIRCEHGMHEKTGKFKTRISSTRMYPMIGDAPDIVWDKYVKQMKINTRRKMTTNLKDIDSLPGFQFVVTSEKFRLSDDGRERALFMLIHVLKHKYQDKKDEFIKFLQEWYRYSSGSKLSDRDIENKVNYHWLRDYTIGVGYLNRLLEDIGRGDLIKN